VYEEDGTQIARPGTEHRIHDSACHMDFCWV